MRTLRALSQKHGPLMMLWMGEVPTLVVSSAEAAQAVLKTHDTSFADRYANATLAALTFDCTDLGCAPYGERWRQLRKICVLELLSSARVQSFHRIREVEVARFVENLAASAAAGASVDVSDGLARFINDAFVRTCVGSRCKQQGEYLHAFHEAIKLTSGLTAADLFPSSRVMQMLGSSPRKAVVCRDGMRRIIEEIIREKSEAMDRGDEAAHEGFIGVLLSLQKQGGTSIPITNDTIALLMFVSRPTLICSAD
jgi:Arc/MetJ family transcription regulator